MDQDHSPSQSEQGGSPETTETPPAEQGCEENPPNNEEEESPSEGGPRSGSLSRGKVDSTQCTQSTFSPLVDAESGLLMPSQNTSESASASTSQVESDWGSRVLREEEQQQQQQSEGGQATSCTGVSQPNPHGPDENTLGVSTQDLSIGDSTLGAISTPPPQGLTLPLGDGPPRGARQPARPLARPRWGLVPRPRGRR